MNILPKLKFSNEIFQVIVTKQLWDIKMHLGVKIRLDHK